MGRKTIARDATLRWLKAMRMPLSAVEGVARRAGVDAERLPPAKAFGAFEAAVKDTVGRLTGDDELRGLARLQRAEQEQRATAATKQQQAAATRAKATAEADLREAALERQREEVERRAAERAEAVEAERREAEQRVAQAANQRRARVKQEARTVERAVDDHALAARAERLAAEAEAIQAREEALAAQAAVLDLDRAVKTKKAARKGG